ncbi:MAG TPA: altronate dehydratase family protein [Gemmatimonadaceae bacterium]|nr:altronate dehydratase family protein [Gemmatimonadaceae bacterium]
MTVGVARPTAGVPAPTGEPRAIRIDPADDVAVAVHTVPAGESVRVGADRIVAREEIPAGHKVALRDLAPGDPVHKYGFPIGLASAAIARGAWVHSHNLDTRLGGVLEYRYAPGERRAEARPAALPTFMGYRRTNGRAGTRNEIWIVNTVGCVNTAADRIARVMGERLAGQVDGVHAFAHPYGCSQLGDDLKNTQRVLAGLVRHPNAGGVLVLGLGCENNQMASLLEAAGDVDRDRLRFFNMQDVMDELDEGSSAISELAARVAADRREACPVSDLVLGHKCGGSDGFSGISANAVLGRIADRLTAQGGGVLLTEVPEMFGAEQVLMNRAADDGVFRDVAAMINEFKQYFLDHGQPVYENPSPGNKAGGLTTLEEKSLGAIQKGGHATVQRVLRYGAPVPAGEGGGGLSLLEAPGNDAVSSTAMVASGATLLLFTTGRGTPLGFPVPTVKVSSNSEIARRKPHWIDFDCGPLLDGSATMDQLADELFALVLEVASGRSLANNEQHGYREIAIWKEGVTL